MSKKSIFLVGLIAVVFHSSAQSQTQVIARGTGTPPLSLDEVPLSIVAPPNANYGVGLSDRDADHGTVAINSNRDIVVAFHSTRIEDQNDLPSPTTNGREWGGTMKQVELAYYKYNSSNDDWSHLGTRVIGSVEYSPITLLGQDLVKCERPDVVAVGDKFFVHWTRRYYNDPRWTDQEYQPAVLECAFVSLNSAGTDFEVTGTEGIGYPIDEHTPLSTIEKDQFEVKECAGVADAVPLFGPGCTPKYEVAVVYPHQTVFSSGTNLNRTFDLRVATCTLVGSAITVTKADNPLYTGIKFNGPPVPNGEPSPGLILPDLAPSKEENAFWIIHERQKMIPVTGSTPQPDGRIRLEYFQLISGDWESQASKLFKSPTGGGTYYWRRRPTISAYPDCSSDILCSVAFGQVNSFPRTGDISANVVYEHWEYSNNSLSSPPAFLGTSVTTPWPNVDSLWDDRPSPLQGRQSPLTWRCYATRMSTSPTLPQSPPADLMGLDPNPPGAFNLLAGNNAYYKGIQRPASAYFYDDSPGALRPDYFVVTYEQRNAYSERRVFIDVH